MSNFKLSLTAAAFVAIAVSAPVFAAESLDEGFCSDISFNNPDCVTYLPPASQQSMEMGVRPLSQVMEEGPSCFDITFGNKDCSVYLAPTAKKTENKFNQPPTYFCSVPANPDSPSC